MYFCIKCMYISVVKHFKTFLSWEISFPWQVTLTVLSGCITAMDMNIKGFQMDAAWCRHFWKITPKLFSPVLEQFETFKACVLPTGMFRKLTVATAKAAHMHLRATFWLWMLSRIWKRKLNWVFCSSFRTCYVSKHLATKKLDTLSTGNM